MTKNFVAKVEQHIEKGILGLAAVFLGAMLWFYFVNSPNKVQFEGKQLGPNELNQAIDDSAKRLDAKVRAKREAPANTEEPFSARLQANFTQGIFAKASPPPKPADAAALPDAKVAAPPVPVKETLRLATTGGPAIVIPGEEEKKDLAPVTLVTPLKPMDVKAATGISLVVRKTRKLGESPAPAAALTATAKDADKANEPVERSWVTVAGWFNKEAQESDTIEAKYAAERRKFYCAGLDVERRELLASGEWSDWAMVEGSKAIPEFKLPTPIIKDDGSVVNRKEMDETWSIVKREQVNLMQPKFLEVQKGDEWRMPHEEPEDPETPTTERKIKPAAKPKPQPRGGGNRGGFSGGGARGGGGFSGDGGGGGARGHGAPGGADTSAKDKEANKKKAREDLAAAKTAVREKDYQTASNHAQSVLSNDQATDQQKKEATGIVEDAQKKMEVPMETVGGRVGIRGDIMGDSTAPPMTRGGFAAPAAATPQSVAAQLVTSDAGAPAVWFHDDTVEPGKTYEYRMRVRMWNRYLGQVRAVAKPDDARKAYLEGEWSAPTDPITVAPSTHFFVVGKRPESSAANVEVWKWIRGKWLKQSFEAHVGDVVGGTKMMDPSEADIAPEPKDSKDKDSKSDTKPKKVAVDFATGAIVLDLRVEKVQYRTQTKGGFQWGPRDSLILTYLDPVDGQVKERSQVLDQVDPVRKTLANANK